MRSVKLTFKLPVPKIWSEFVDFLRFIRRYFRLRGYVWFSRFEEGKSVIVDLLYKQRGKYTRPFLHFGTIALVFLVITFGPLLLSSVEEDKKAELSRGVLTTVSAYDATFQTLQAEDVRQFRSGEIITHVVQDGETLSGIASLYGLQPTTITWENAIDEKAKLKPGQELRILPINGVRHKVERGETIYTVAKKYGLEDAAEAQKIVNYPFNEFLNDETFELATGQFIMVPDGVKRTVSAPATSRSRPVITPDAGSVAATGSFVWPASGRITQGYLFYHRGIDIANLGGGQILAADAGTVVTASWDGSGYGNRVIIDHGNGYTTLYAHMRVLQVTTGQKINRGNVIGQMGSTGRSTGVHLHFEMRQGGTQVSPLNFLR